MIYKLGIGFHTDADVPAIARSLVNLFGDSLQSTKLVAISPLTAGVLSKSGYRPAVIAQEYTTNGLVNAILNNELKNEL